MTTADGPGSAAPVPAPATVLLCSDIVGPRPGEFSPELICAGLRRSTPEVRVFVVPDLCSRSSGLPAGMPALGNGRVVVGCRRGRAKRPRIMGVLRAAGVHGALTQVVDLAPGEGARPHEVVEQSVAKLRAALARVSCTDISAPVAETAVPLGTARFSRRNLFSLGYLAGHPVAGWRGDHCGGRGASRPCVQACPYQALSLAGPRISVEGASCTGCGACVAACRSGAMSLDGTSMAELAAAAGTLVEDACRLGLGVAVVCSAAVTDVPLGGPWLALEVPSLEMVSTGWVLQIVAAGARATALGCGEKACTGRARELTRLAAAVVSQVAPGRRHLVVGPGDRSRAGLGGELGVDASPLGRPRSAVLLHEPEATVQALSALTEQPGPWRLESPVAPLGEIVIDGERCSACECCVTACPTGAISASDGPGRGTLVLEFEPSACPACGACVSSCPEGAVSLRRAIGSSCLAAGRQAVAEVARFDRCVSCGKPVGEGVVTRVVAAKLVASHPEIAGRLRGHDRCPGCLLTMPGRTGTSGIA